MLHSGNLSGYVHLPCLLCTVATVKLTINGGVCEGNSALWGGCIEAEENANVTLTGGFQCFNNQAGECGGCIGASASAHISITGASEIRNNTASSGAGLYVEGEASAVVAGQSSIVFNAAEGRQTIQHLLCPSERNIPACHAQHNCVTKCCSQLPLVSYAASSRM